MRLEGRSLGQISATTGLKKTTIRRVILESRSMPATNVYPRNNQMRHDGN
jgi:hypothetical protein